MRSRREIVTRSRVADGRESTRTLVVVHLRMDAVMLLCCCMLLPSRGAAHVVGGLWVGSVSGVPHRSLNGQVRIYPSDHGEGVSNAINSRLLEIVSRYFPDPALPHGGHDGT